MFNGKRLTFGHSRVVRPGSRPRRLEGHKTLGYTLDYTKQGMIVFSYGFRTKFLLDKEMRIPGFLKRPYKYPFITDKTAGDQRKVPQAEGFVVRPRTTFEQAAISTYQLRALYQPPLAVRSKYHGP